MMKLLHALFLLAAAGIALFSLSLCGAPDSNQTPEFAPSHKKMLDILAQTGKKQQDWNNPFASDRRVLHFDSLIWQSTDENDRLMALFFRAGAYLDNGEESRSVADYEALLKYPALNPDWRKHILSGLGIAYLRLGERNNCIYRHSPESCIMPIQGTGIHQDKTGAQKAVEIYETLLKDDPEDWDSRWLLNIAYMTMGAYPDKVPPQWLVPGLNAQAPYPVKAFVDIAENLGVATKDLAGGVIVDDFDEDGYLDIVTSAWGHDEPMHYFHNNADGTFSNRSQESGLASITGGSNLTSTDYNNDGYLDIFVLRGGWRTGNFGNQPNSLLRNNGDGTFTDVTVDAGILSYHPTQTATWNDFNRDGWLDVFIGNESPNPQNQHPCELYLNNKNGTFTNVASPDELNIVAFVKAVSSGDYDNDGWPDIFISTMNNRQLLLHNRGAQANTVSFEMSNGLPDQGNGTARSFPASFLDLDNDGWLDIFFGNYEFERPLSYYAAKEAVHPSDDITGKLYVYHNNGDGTFSDVTVRTGLNSVCFGMSANFGDINNDGWPDLYLGTGNPNYRSILPNRLFLNLEGKKFADVTISARVGNLQKGHGIAFADLDNDGDQDIYAEMGGAYKGDAYPNSFYLNPELPENNWICLQLEGVQTNRVAIGAKVTLKFHENGRPRMIYREVNSGASFGCSPLRREIGIGKATVIDEITIQWPVSKKVQTLKNIQPNQFLRIREGTEGAEPVKLHRIAFKDRDGSVMPMCAPAK